MSSQQFFFNHEGKNSSRVLQQPGGKSSFSFGDYSPDPQPKKQQLQHQQPPPPPPQQQQQQQPQQYQQYQQYQPQQYQQQPQQQQYQQEATKAPFMAAPLQPRNGPLQPPSHGRKTSNLHGDPQGSEGNTRSVHTSSRVLAPPGGFTHNIFG
eukprot:m.53351 g.53351  ORF g.53351 m.53351 type:complete len:152 (+) comp7663_c0_seq3:239-694(+)